MKKYLASVSARLRGRKGQGMMEYALIVFAITTAAAGTYMAYGNFLLSFMGGVSGAL